MRGVGRPRVRELELAGQHFRRATGRRPVPPYASGPPPPGTLRAHLIERGELVERRITLAEPARARAGLSPGMAEVMLFVIGSCPLVWPAS